MDQATMLAWYGSLLPLKVDVVGDFAGKELFAIHGDSMLLHCLAKAKVDYDRMSLIIGFLLHIQYDVLAHSKSWTLTSLTLHRWVSTSSCHPFGGDISRQPQEAWMQIPRFMVRRPRGPRRSYLGGAVGTVPLDSCGFNKSSRAPRTFGRWKAELPLSFHGIRRL